MRFHQGGQDPAALFSPPLAFSRAAEETDLDFVWGIAFPPGRRSLPWLPLQSSRQEVKPELIVSVQIDLTVLSSWLGSGLWGRVATKPGQMDLLGP